MYHKVLHYKLGTTQPINTKLLQLVPNFRDHPPQIRASTKPCSSSTQWGDKYQHTGYMYVVAYTALWISLRAATHGCQVPHSDTVAGQTYTWES